MIQTRLQQTLRAVQILIAEQTGNDLDEVHPDAQLDEELNISLTEFVQIVRQINRQFGVTLNAKEIHEEVETVLDLATAVNDELELG